MLQIWASPSKDSKQEPPLYLSTFTFQQTLSNLSPVMEPSVPSEGYLTRPRTLQFWASAMVVLPVFLQAPWVHLQPVAACLFTFVILGLGLALVRLDEDKWSNTGSLLVGISASWLGGCLFWGWLREYPVLHLPVEAIVLPLALVALGTRWRIGASFYLASLLGTAFTDLMMLSTGVMHSWPVVVKAPLGKARELLKETAQQILEPQPILLLLGAAILILGIASFMRKKALVSEESASAWIVASAALTTTLWVDGLFLITALIQPRLSGLI